jgi:predicted RNase H-like nuclease (RuvC/YqgF family)
VPGKTLNNLGEVCCGRKEKEFVLDRTEKLKKSENNKEIESLKSKLQESQKHIEVLERKIKEMTTVKKRVIKKNTVKNEQ